MSITVSLTTLLKGVPGVEEDADLEEVDGVLLLGTAAG